MIDFTSSPVDMFAEAPEQQKRSVKSSEGPYYAEPRLSSHLPLTAKAFCAVALNPAICGEVELLLRTFRRHHTEPFLLVCDTPVAAHVSTLGLEKIDVVRTTPQMMAHAESLSKNTIRHHPYWKPEAIALKFHALKTCIERYGPSHLLDADIVVNTSLHAGGPWMADLVLSPHYAPFSNPNPFHHGFLNAGYVLARKWNIVDRWEKMYSQGLGGFYEQKCLETLSHEFVTAWFGHEHNFAKWRWEAPTRRPIVSLHHKLCAKGDCARVQDMHKAVSRVINANSTPKKIAHIHCVRSWGTYFRSLMRESISPTLGLQNLVSWDLDLQREWTEAELLLLAEGKLWGQHPGGCAFVHNHTFSWTEKALDAFNDHDWLTVALVRDPREVLVSLAAWSLDATKPGRPCPVWYREGINNTTLAAAASLEEAVEVLLTDTTYHPQWVLPPWLHKVKWIRKAGAEAITEFCQNICLLPEVPSNPGVNQNSSSSKGWQEEKLPPKLRRSIEKHPEVKKWDTFLKTIA